MKAGSFLGGLITGAAIGAVIALLYAPKSGKETRVQIKKKIDELENDLKEMREKLKEKGGEFKDDIKQKIKDIEERLQCLYRKTEEETV